MKNFAKRSISITMALMLCISLLFSISLSTSAATVDYVYSGSYIKNWGTREVEATFLSPKAESFYSKNNTSYNQLSSLSGSSNTSQVMSSALYKELQRIMKSNHKKITSYNDTRYMFQHTDCENSGKTSNKISSFYSGVAIGPSWDGGSTWNREHTWPNSKGDGDGENDIMMLRPTSSSENSSRGNKAYGKSSNFYNPNKESNNSHDLRGDVARIVLYQHVRWAQTKLFGASGVIESKAVLLEWIQADPVDTWELGRNDSVESITGTRNIFVDYPELAFILFGEQVPAHMTPSGIAKNGTANNNNNNNNNTTSTPSNNQNNNNTQNSNQNNNTQSKPATTSCQHPNAQTVAAEEPRCGLEGYTEGKYCPDCKKYISGHQAIAAIEHVYGGECDDTCDNCGAKREVLLAHNFDDTATCTVCGAQGERQPDTTSSEITSDLTQSDSNDDTEKSGFKWWIVLVAAGAVVLVGGVVVIIVFREKIWPKKEQ